MLYRLSYSRLCAEVLAKAYKVYHRLEKVHLLYVTLYSEQVAFALAKATVVGRAGFEPTKAMPTDLQSAPFDRFGIFPLFLKVYSIISLNLCFTLIGRFCFQNRPVFNDCLSTLKTQTLNSIVISEKGLQMYKYF
jgi:hypothetical protein